MTTKRNKVLKIAVDGETKDLALVDLCLTSDIWVGSRAIWKPERVRDIFVTFATADAIGLSSVAGLINPIPRDLNQGLHLVLCPPGTGIQTLYAPIAPGLILPVGIAEINTMKALEVKTFPLKERLYRWMVSVNLHYVKRTQSLSGWTPKDH